MLTGVLNFDLQMPGAALMFLFIKLSLATVEMKTRSNQELQLYKNVKQIGAFGDFWHRYNSIMLHSVPGKWIFFHSKIQKKIFF